MEGTRNREVLTWVLLGLLLAVAGALLLTLTAKINFITDEWNLLFLRPDWGPGSFLEPFHEHIIIAPAFIYKVLQAIFGMESNRPFQVVAIGGFLTVGVLLFIWMRRRIGSWAALIGTAMILFLGAAFEDLLWAFQIGFYGSLACGLGALIALDRDDRKGDIAAAVLLVLSLTFSSVGMPFVAGAAAEWLLNPRDRRRRWMIPAAAVAFYVLWWLGWGHQAESGVTLTNLPDAPAFVFNAAAAAVTSLLGLATGDGSEPEQPHLIWGRIGLLILLGLSAWRLWRLQRIPAGVIVTGTIAIAFFGLAAMGQTEFRLPTSSRYQLPGALFLLLFFTEILRGLELKPVILGAAAVVVLFTSLLGVDLMQRQATVRWGPASDWTNTYLGAVAFAGQAADQDLVLNLGPGSEVPRDRFLEEVEASGLPGFSRAKIEAGDAGVRAHADQVLVDSTSPLLTGERPATTLRDCQRFAPGSTAAIAPAAAVVEIRNRDRTGALSLGLSRFGDPPGVPVGSVISGSRAWLQLAAIESEPVWKITGDRPFAVCQE